MDEGTFNLPIFMIAGDLNLTWLACEIQWGQKTKLDPLSAYFEEIFGRADLVYVEPVPICPTWSNGRVGEERVAKRLDGFLLSIPLIEKLDK